MADAQRLIGTLLPAQTTKIAVGIPLSNLAPLRDLQGALDGLRAACAAAGASDAFDQLTAALTRVGDLPTLAAKAQSPEERDATVALLQLHVESATQAIAPGRDGAALVSLYGQSAALDTAIDKLRTHATTRLLESHGVGEMATGQAQTLVKQERAIAEGRLEIQRLLAKESGFAPPLGALRIDSAMVDGLQRANPDAVRRAGILLGSVLSQQQALAASPAAQNLRAALQEQHAAATTREQAIYLRQRISALAEQPLAIGLPADTLDRLKLGSLSAEEVIQTIRGLAARGLSGVGEVENLIGAAGSTLAQVGQSRQRLDKLDQAYQKNLDLERGNVLAGGLLRHTTGHASLDVDSTDQVRQALTGAGAPLAALAKGSVGASISASAARYAEIANVEAAEKCQSVVSALDRFSAPANPADAASIDRVGAELREEQKSVMAERLRLMGPEVAAALNDTLRAAVLMTRTKAVKGDPAESGVKAKLGNALKNAGQGIKAGLQGKTASEKQIEEVMSLLDSWGIDAAAVAPEVQQLVQQPLDTARLDQWFNDLAPSGAVKERWNADKADLAARMQPGAASHLASASLARFSQALDTLEPGTQLNWNLAKQSGATTGLVKLPAGIVAGMQVQLSAGMDKNSQILASRDANGYQLVLRSGTAVQGDIALAAAIGALGGYLGLQATTTASARTHRLDGVALRFPDTEAGRENMKNLLLRLQEQGGLETKDLLNAEQVLPVVEQITAGQAKLDVRLDATVPFAHMALSGADAADTLNAAPRLNTTLSAGIGVTHATAGNSRQQIRNSETAYSMDVTAVPSLRMGVTVASEAGLGAKLGLGDLLPNASMTLAGPVPGSSKTMNVAKFACKASTQEVRENGLLTDATERSVRVGGPSALMTSAVGQAGGDQLQALAEHLKDSPDPAHQTLRQQMADLLKTTVAGEEVRVVWRIAPEVRQRANALLEQARGASAGQGGHAPGAGALKHAEQLEKQAQALLADPGSYRLHALEKVATEQTSAKLGGLFDGGYVDLSYVKHGKEAQASHERIAGTIVFDPGLVQNAMNSSPIQAEAST
jgi:hypothetical protein